MKTSNLDNSTADILEALRGVERLLVVRRTHLNALVEGRATLTPEAQRRVVQDNSQIRRILGYLADDFLSESTRRQMVNKRGSLDNDTTDSLSALPGRLKGAYELLVIAAYGSLGTGALSRSEEQGKLGKSEGKAVEWRVSSGKESTGRAAGGPKKIGANKGVIKNEAAFNQKRKVDKRLRRLAVEIEEFLGSPPEKHQDRICSKCHKYGDPDWGFCPRCGGSMTVLD